VHILISWHLFYLLWHPCICCGRS